MNNKDLHDHGIYLKFSDDGVITSEPGIHHSNGKVSPNPSEFEGTGTIQLFIVTQHDYDNEK